MKKLLIASILLLSAPAYAELTLSLDLIKDSGERDFELSGYWRQANIDSDADSTGYRLRLGFGSVAESRAELYFSQYDVDDQGQFNSEEELEFGVNYIRTFPQKSVIPFLKAGLGVGLADTDTRFITTTGDTTDNIWNVHFNLGAGLSYSFTDNLAVTADLGYVYRVWQEIDYGNSVTMSITDSLFRFGVGLDMSF
ncbi:MAG: outer membrane beta-barrel protein [Pseudomonadota bacterium]